ncbi:MAG: hypothetical protein KAX49_07870 [Halanaerobiales bacterium]|nr:hypothetical protein [Halanaerobiales bacterium]
MAGGHFATHESEAILENVEEVDLVIRGEGEETFLRLIQALENGESYEDIQGIVFRKDSAIINNGRSPIIQDIDKLPSPNYLFKEQILKLGYIPIFTNRGCYASCNVCSVAAFFGNHIVRRRSYIKVVLLLLTLNTKILLCCIKEYHLQIEN